MSDTPNLKLPYILGAQAQKHVTHNEAIRALDALVQLSVLDLSLTAPPPSPDDGDRYIVAASASSDWAGHETQIAAWQDNAWAFYRPLVGWLAWVTDEQNLYSFNGTSWLAVSVGGGGISTLNPAEGGLVGVNGTADANNRLTVSSPATLLNHEGNGHQLKINKSGASDTNSLLYQTGFSGRAEIGLTGDDDFHFKVSPDGAVWREALSINRNNANISFGATPGSDKVQIIGDNTADSAIGDLSVHKNNYWSFNFFTTYSNTSAHHPTLTLRKASGSKASPGSVADGESLGEVSFQAHNGSSYLQSAYVAASIDGTVDSGHMPTRLQLATTDTLTPAVRLEIEPGGTVRPGTDNSQSFGSASYRWSSIWSVNGTIQTSDMRDKDIIGSLQSFASDLVDGIEPVMFRWKAGSNTHVSTLNRGHEPAKTKPSERVHAGWLAQDFQAALAARKVDFGAWGLDDKEDPKSRQWLRPDELIPILWESLRQTRNDVKALQARLDMIDSA